VPIVGMVVAFVAAVLSIRWMVAYLQARSLAGFGVYRLGAAAVAAILLLANVV
jgi:undecaprenyl-diphosphatase